MELQKYLDQELKDAIRSVRVNQGKAKDSGNIYYYISLVFVNGYEYRIFMNNEQRFAILNALDQLEQQERLDDEYNN